MVMDIEYLRGRKVNSENLKSEERERINSARIFNIKFKPVLYHVKNINKNKNKNC